MKIIQMINKKTANFFLANRLKGDFHEMFPLEIYPLYDIMIHTTNDIHNPSSYAFGIRNTRQM